jgi:ABC-type polysaccharide/polyol phosphate transport system ATPase subunit
LELVDLTIGRLDRCVRLGLDSERDRADFRGRTEREIRKKSRLIRQVADPAFKLDTIIENVVKTYGDKYALRGVTFSVPVGQVCGLLGPNGAGKTMLLRLLMGILKDELWQACNR